MSRHCFWVVEDDWPVPERICIVKRDELVKALGPYVSLTGREQLRRFLNGDQLFLRYEHVKDWNVLKKIIEEQGYDILEGAEGLEVLVGVEAC